jgi:hypothetical protein
MKMINPSLDILPQTEFEDGTGVDPICTQKRLADLESVVGNVKFSITISKRIGATKREQKIAMSSRIRVDKPSHLHL